MKNVVIQDFPDDITRSGYKIYTHGGRLLVESYCRWSGGWTATRLVYVGEDVAWLAEQSAEYIEGHLVTSRYIHGCLNKTGLVLGNWKITDKGFVVH